jgi:hypothetical protein
MLLERAPSAAARGHFVRVPPSSGLNAVRRCGACSHCRRAAATKDKSCEQIFCRCGIRRDRHGGGGGDVPLCSQRSLRRRCLRQEAPPCQRLCRANVGSLVDGHLWREGARGKCAPAATSRRTCHVCAKPLLLPRHIRPFWLPAAPLQVHLQDRDPTHPANRLGDGLREAHSHPAHRSQIAAEDS